MFEDNTEARDLEMDQDVAAPVEAGTAGQDFYYEDLESDTMDQPALDSDDDAGFYEELDEDSTVVNDPALDQSSDDLADI